jgi:hypothetical protein
VPVLVLVPELELALELALELQLACVVVEWYGSVHRDERLANTATTLLPWCSARQQPGHADAEDERGVTSLRCAALDWATDWPFQSRRELLLVVFLLSARPVSRSS